MFDKFFFLALFPIILEASFIDYVKPKLISGRCRATCIQTYIVENSSSIGCNTETNWKCHMCWDYCDMLIRDTTRNEMCDDNNICLDGCQTACEFYNDKNVEKWTHQDGEIKDVDVKVRSNSSSTLSWNFGTTGGFFIIFGSGQDGEWIELNQTYENHIWIEENDERIFNVTIFGLTSSGLISSASKSLVENETLSNVPNDVKKSDIKVYEWVVLHWLASGGLLTVLSVCFCIMIKIKLKNRDKNVNLANNSSCVDIV